MTAALLLIAAGPLAPPWAVFPMALITMIIIAGHLRGVARADVPASRRRIRTANGWLMMFLAIALACATGVVSTADKRTFVLCWMAVAGLTGMVLLLAWADAFNSLRMHRQARRELRGQFGGLVAGQIAAHRSAQLSASRPAPAADSISDGSAADDRDRS